MVGKNNRLALVLELSNLGRCATLRSRLTHYFSSKHIIITINSKLGQRYVAETSQHLYDKNAPGNDSNNVEAIHSEATHDDGVLMILQKSDLVTTNMCTRMYNPRSYIFIIHNWSSVYIQLVCTCTLVISRSDF